MVTTQHGKHIEIISQTELRDPYDAGEHVRAYCHIHGSDHQRSLSINRATGWGHCFNATCNATVLVAEWNPGMAKHLLYARYQPALPAPRAVQKPLPFRLQPAHEHFFHPPPAWQQAECAALRGWAEHMHAGLAHSRQARLYLRERKIPLEVALRAGVGYIPPALISKASAGNAKKSLHRWAERIVFPLATPEHSGYIGRTLRGWQPGMDENAHKALLDQSRRLRRWIKTNPAGWFTSDLSSLPDRIIFVEGAFDRLTLITAGLPATHIVALVGTSIPGDWLPPQVREVILALDSDQGGQDATVRLTDQLEEVGVRATACPPPQDRWGKDWNERWRRIGPQSVWPLLEAYRTIPSV